MSLFVDTHGHGPVPLVMIHGWAMHGGVFEPLVELLTDRCTMYVVDLPGHGRSRGSHLPLTLDACAQAVAAATPPAAWLGWSLGGLVALQAALTMPAHIRALAMLCAAPRFSRAPDWPHGADPRVLRQLAGDLDTEYHATLDRFFVLEAMGSADPAAELRRLREEAYAHGEPDPRVLAEGIGVLERADLRAHLSELTCPNLWLAGQRDRLAAPAAMSWSAEQAHGDYAVIGHAGHAPFIGHAPALARALAPLLDGLRDG